MSGKIKLDPKQFRIFLEHDKEEDRRRYYAFTVMRRLYGDIKSCLSITDNEYLKINCIASLIATEKVDTEKALLSDLKTYIENTVSPLSLLSKEDVIKLIDKYIEANFGKPVEE